MQKSHTGVRCAVRAGFAIAGLVLLISCPGSLFLGDTFAETENGNGRTFFVSGNDSAANDGNPGTEDKPWATIEHAVAQAGPGATVYLRGGVYHERLVTERNGTASSPITFASASGETAILDGAGGDVGNNGVVVGHSHIRLKGLEIRNWNENGIWTENAGFLEISDCVVHDVAYGVGLADGTHDFTINRVIAHHFDLYGFDASASGGSPCYKGVFNDCIAYGGRDRDQNVDGFALGHGDQHGFEFNRCETYDVYDGFDISSRDTTLRRCSAHDCWNGAYKLWQDNVRLENCIGYSCESSVVELDWDEHPGTVTLQNCTFAGSGTFTIWIENGRDALHMFNCIVARGENIGLAFEQRNASNYRGDYNLFHNANASRAIAVGYEDEFSLGDVAQGAWKTYSGQDVHSIAVTSDGAVFRNAAAPDLHLADASPAIDAGTGSGAPSADFEGTSRPRGSGYDMGAYER